MSVIPLPTRAQPRTSSERVSRNIKRLMADYGATQEMIAAVLGIRQPQVSTRLRGKVDWSLTEVDAVAAYFHVSPVELLDGVDAGPSGDGGGRARRDSNPQPSDPKVVVAAFGGPKKVAAQVPAAA